MDMGTIPTEGRRNHGCFKSYGNWSNLSFHVERHSSFSDPVPISTTNYENNLYIIICW
jgi:hypothetical protein